jgi:hypothetical protein
MSSKTINTARTEATDAQQRKPGSIEIGKSPIKGTMVLQRGNLPPSEASARHIKYGTGPSADAGADADHAADGELRSKPTDAPKAASQPHGSANDADIPASEARPNGDEVDFRMEKIAEILGHAAMSHLEKSDLVAEWVHHAGAKHSVFGQPVQKPEGGRPEGGIARAARELPVPGKTVEARRQYIRRAIKIAGIWDEAKSAACAAGLDNNKSALFDIADEHSLEAQLAKVREIAARRAQPRRRRTVPPAVTGDTNLQIVGGVNVPELAMTPVENQTPEEKARLAVLRDSWNTNNVLTRSDWESSSPSTRRRFTLFLLGREEAKS